MAPNRQDFPGHFAISAFHQERPGSEHGPLIKMNFISDSIGIETGHLVNRQSPTDAIRTPRARICRQGLERVFDSEATASSTTMAVGCDIIVIGICICKIDRIEHSYRCDRGLPLGGTVRHEQSTSAPILVFGAIDTQQELLRGWPNRSPMRCSSVRSPRPQGGPAPPARLPSGLLLLKQSFAPTDEEVVRRRAENPMIGHCHVLQEAGDYEMLAATDIMRLRNQISAGSWPRCLCD